MTAVATDANVPGADGRIAQLRAFNRFWTGVIHVLNEGLLDSPYSLTEARVIYELAQVEQLDLLELRLRLDIDPGYLSRIIGRFKSDGLVEARTSSTDGRRQVLWLTTRGREVFAMLDQRSAAENGALLARLDDQGQRRLLAAMATIRQIVEPGRTASPYTLRGLRPGDLGWVVQRHGALYAEEYGWDQTFEALVARIVGDYGERHDPDRETAWIAELDGEPVACLFCLTKDEQTAQLRILLVEPRGRGLGIGARLIEEGIRFARQAGYRRLTLWTNDVLVSARRIYEAAGFELVCEEPHHSFGHDLVSQTWELDL